MRLVCRIIWTGLQLFLILQAVDLYVLLSSFLPKGGELLSVAVYPSDFGVQRMEYESKHGPAGFIENDEDKNLGDDNDEDSDSEINNEKLRAYEKSRLRWDWISTSHFVNYWLRSALLNLQKYILWHLFCRIQHLKVVLCISVTFVLHGTKLLICVLSRCLYTVCLRCIKGSSSLFIGNLLSMSKNKKSMRK